MLLNVNIEQLLQFNFSVDKLLRCQFNFNVVEFILNNFVFIISVKKSRTSPVLEKQVKYQITPGKRHFLLAKLSV